MAAVAPAGSDLYVYRSLRQWRGSGSCAGLQEGTGYALAFTLGLGLDGEVVDELETEVKASLAQTDSTGLAVSQIPCGSSAGEFCSKGGTTTAEECPHFAAWLEAGWKSRVSHISKAKAAVRERTMPAAVTGAADAVADEDLDGEGDDEEVLDNGGEVDQEYEMQEDAGYE